VFSLKLVPKGFVFKTNAQKKQFFNKNGFEIARENLKIVRENPRYRYSNKPEYFSTLYCI
jgi:hypothetical protein